MSNAEINQKFFTLADAATQTSVVTAVASHYGIGVKEAKAELLDPDAEHLLDYLIEPVRSATRAVMMRHGLSA